jgi:hypothetical protein
MLKSLDRPLLDKPKEGDELKMEDDDCPMDGLKRISEKLSLDTYFNGAGTNVLMITKILLSMSTALSLLCLCLPAQRRILTT